jgi:hypothetical protein
MALARKSPSFVLLVALAGCGAGAARGCGTACRGSGGLARTGARGAEDLARLVPRSAPVRYGTRSLVVPAHVGGELGQLGERAALAHLDDAVAALPPAQGPVSALAKAPAKSGAVMTGKPGARSLADDYARSIDSLGVTPRQHVDLLDAFDVAQSLLDAAQSDADPVDDDIARERLERARLALIAGRLEARLELALGDAQLQRLYAALGSPQVIAYRLSRERPMQRPAQQPTTSGAPAAP